MTRPTIVRRALLAALPLLSVTCSAHAQGDPEVIKRIIDQGKNNSHIWVYETFLAEEIGPRLTGSTRVERANNWTRDLFERFGCTNAHLFKWGEMPVRFDRGPSYCKMTKPVAKDFEFTTRSWSAGTDGPVKGKVVRQPANMEELEKMKAELKGAWVLSKPLQRGGRRGVIGPDTPTTAPAAGVANAGAAAGVAAAPNGGAPAADAPPARNGGGNPNAPAGGDGNAPPRRPPGGPGGSGGTFGQNQELIDALYAAGIAGRIVSSGNDLVITSGSYRDVDFDNLPTQVAITVRRADYDSINSRLADGEEVEIEANLQHKFTKGPIPLYDTIAEIPGTEFPEQVVIISGHLDSWDGPGSQGAQDNGTGTSVTVEAARILTAAGVKPRRTIRFILWTGEEQGLLGSKGYVDSLSDEEKANVSCVLVDDGGTNYEGGLVCVKEMEDMLKKATDPVNGAFPDMKVDILVRPRMPRGGGSDHATFNAAGIPGFFWEEDGTGGREGKNYTYVHHTQYDTTRFAVPEYLVQSATCSAVTAYNLAMADTMLPRYVPAPPPPEDTSPFTPTPGPITGTWVGTTIRDGQPSDFTFTFTLEQSTEGTMRGQMYSRFGGGGGGGGGGTPIRAIAYKSDTGEITFKVENDFGAQTYKATLKGDDMTDGAVLREDVQPVGGNRSTGPAPITTFTAHRDTTEIKPPAAPERPAGGGQGGQRRGGGAGTTGGN